jgi:hypothetical protein
VDASERVVGERADVSASCAYKTPPCVRLSSSVRAENIAVCAASVRRQENTLVSLVSSSSSSVCVRVRDS